MIPDDFFSNKCYGICFDALMITVNYPIMEKVLKKRSHGPRLSSPKVVRLYPGKKTLHVKNSKPPSTNRFPIVQMPPQPEAYLKANEFDFL